MSRHRRPGRLRASGPSGPSTKQLLQQIIALLQNMNVPPDDGQDYQMYLRRLQRMKILRDLVYPSYQNDWG